MLGVNRLYDRQLLFSIGIPKYKLSGPVIKIRGGRLCKADALPLTNNRVRPGSGKGRVRLLSTLQSFRPAKGHQH